MWLGRYGIGVRVFRYLESQVHFHYLRVVFGQSFCLDVGGII